MSKHSDADSVSVSPTATPEAIVPIRRHTIPKLGERAIGRLTYTVGVGASGTVSVAVIGNEGGGYFSPEWVSLLRIRACLADALDHDRTVTAALLRAAYVDRSQNNGGFLAAILRHEGLLKAGDQLYHHRGAGDWEAWEAEQVRLWLDGESWPSAATETPPEGEKATSSKRRKGKSPVPPGEESGHADA